MNGNCAELTREEKAFGLMRETGETIKDSAKTVGRSRSTGQRMEKKVKQLTLAAPSSVNTAIRSLKKIAAGKAVNGVEPNAQTIVAACKEFTDRAEPKVTMNQNLNLNVSISPVDLSKYKD